MQYISQHTGVVFFYVSDLDMENISNGGFGALLQCLEVPDGAVTLKQPTDLFT